MRHEGLQIVQQLFVEQLLAGQGAILRAQGLVLEGLELRRDEALGVLERLAPPVVVGHLVELALADFDVEAVHAIELHLEVGDAASGPLARLEFEQEGVAVLADAAQFVQLGIIEMAARLFGMRGDRGDRQQRQA